MYNLCKKMIITGNYQKEDMSSKLDIYLLKNRITEEQYNDPAVIGYKAKLMKSAYTLQNGEPRFIKVAHRGEYTKEEQEELRKIEQKRKLEDKERE